LIEDALQICPVCYCEKKLSVRLGSCGHEFCEECVESHIKHFMENNLSTLAPKCLNYHCKISFTEGDIQKYATHEDYTRYSRYKDTIKVVTGGNMRFCPSPKCDNVINLS